MRAVPFPEAERQTGSGPATGSRFPLRHDRPEHAVGDPEVEGLPCTGFRDGADRLPGGAIERDRVAPREHGGRIEGRKLAAENIEVGPPAAVPRVRFGPCAAEKDRELPAPSGNPR